MGHQLATVAATGEAAMFYNDEDGGAPWHRLGKPVRGALKAEEAIGTAGLGYIVDSWPVFADGPSGEKLSIPNLRLNVRLDTGQPLGVVSDRYRIVQNRQAFDFLDSVAQDGQVEYHAAGAFGKGERIWLLAKLPGLIRVRKTDDTIQKYLLLYNSHDASSALRCLWTPTRVICWNTCSAALKAGEGMGISIQHTGEIAYKVEEARRALGLAQSYFQAFGEGADLLAGTQPSREQLETYFKGLFPDPEKGDPAKAKAMRMTLFGLFEKGMGQDMPGIVGTGWAAWNAVTEYVDHHTGTDESRRMASSWWGDGAKLKAKAFDLAVSTFA